MLTSGLEVPATSEVVIEGEIPTDYFERGGTFWRIHGLHGPCALKISFSISNVSPIGRGRSGIPLSANFLQARAASSRKWVLEAAYYKLLKHDLGIHTLVDVALHEESGTQSSVSSA